MTSTITALDYLESQLDLERQARELMPYDPNVCTFDMGELRQPVFACLTCSRQNNNAPIGVCYSCSIQCHSSHDIVELFSKRNFVCDCGTTKMKNTTHGACKIRSSTASATATSQSASTTLLRRSSSSSSNTFKSGTIDLPAEDIPSSGNQYNQNYKGLFCSCHRQYNPLEESGNMIQCYFGFACGEDWFHEECILGYKRGVIKGEMDQKKRKEKAQEGVEVKVENEAKEEQKASAAKSENKLESLEAINAGDDASSSTAIATSTKRQLDDRDADDSGTEEPESDVPYFPNLDDFDSFICWKCVDAFKEVFSSITADSKIVLTRLPHFENVESTEKWKQLYSSLDSKRVKSEDSSASTPSYPQSIFLKPEFRDQLKSLAVGPDTPEKVKQFLSIHDYLFLSDPVYEPPEDDDGTSSNTGSLLDLGAEALSSLPRDQAIEGLQAYDKIKAKLRDFFKPFAEGGKIVTEDEVRNFFTKVKEDES